MTDTTLAPCPFCGGAARHLEERTGFWTERAICDTCNFHLTRTHTESAVTRWNRRASHGQALRLLTQKEKDSLGRRAEGMDGNEWDQWVQEKFAQVNGLKVQGGSYARDWE